MSARTLVRWLSVLALFAASRADAQKDSVYAAGPWKYTSAVGLTLTESAYTSNWAGGDKGTIIWVLNSDLRAERQFSPSYNQSNVLQLAYGQTSQQKADPADPSRIAWSSPDKTTDLIALESVSRWTLRGFADPYFSLRGESQFSDESNPLGSITLNPIKLKEAAGLARVLAKSEDRELITRVGVGMRQTFGKSFVDPVTLAKASFTSNDGGFEWNTTAVWPLLEKKVTYRASLLVFLPVFYSKSDALTIFDAAAIAVDPTRRPVADYWQDPDVNFLNTFTAAITKHLEVGLVAQLVYDKFDTAANVDNSLPLAVLIPEIDKNVRKVGQFKQTLNVTIRYQLF
jgi:hypothetical protein